MARKHPALSDIFRRLTVEFAPSDAERIERELERRRANDPTASYSSSLRDLVRAHLD